MASPEKREELISRRRLLKAIAAAGGTLAAATVLPDKWTKPAAQVGLLPAHAQVSPTPDLGTGDMQATLRWDTDDTDIDLWVIEPDGTEVWWFNQDGTTAELDVDDTDGFGPENVFVGAGEAANGTYQVLVNYYRGEVPTEATIRITVFDGAPGEKVETFTRNLPTEAPLETWYRVADVDYPSGTITERTGTVDLMVAAAESIEK
jgi:hypothetical protein